MITVKILDSPYPKVVFNKLAIHPLQSWEWGEARKKMGIKVVRFGEFDTDRLIAIYQMTVHRLGCKSLALGYLPRSVFPSETILSYLYEYGKKNNLIFIKIEPYTLNNQSPISNNQYPITNYQLKNSPHLLFPPWTQMLDLKADEEMLLKNMKPKTRYNIRLAQKKGVVVKEMSDEKGFEIFQKLYFDTCARQKYYGHTKKYHEIVWNTLKNNISHILIAFYNNKPLAAYELFHFNEKFYYPYGGTSDEDRNVMAANLLMWQAIRLGKRLGAKQFDMWGSLPPDYDQTNPWSGFTRFKEGYGTKFVEMVHGQDLVISPILYSVYNIFYKLRQFYLNLK